MTSTSGTTATRALPADTTGGHPFPQVRRPRWCSLDGRWDFAHDDDDVGTAAGWPAAGAGATGGRRDVTVPFPPESVLSGVGETGHHPVVWYSRRLGRAEAEAAGLGVQGERLLLHFGAVDFRATVWIDGLRVAEHEGGHTPFVADVTEALSPTPDGGDHLLVVRAEDRPLDVGQPRGKQDWRVEPHAIWYARTTGIWQSVWLEAVPRTALAELSWTPNRACDAVDLEVVTTRPVPEGSRISVRLAFAGRPLAEARVRLPETTTARLTVDLREQVHGQRYEKLLWSPEHPRLLDAEVVLEPASAPLAGEPVPPGDLDPAPTPDAVVSYLGLRSVGTAHRRFLLNERPYYVRAVLEQGFWPETHLAAPDDDARRDEVALVRRLGFNAVRVHQKVEDPRFLYWADRLGLMVWSEMPSTYEFTTQAMARTVAEWTEVVRRDRSHPCVITWVPLNESWGVQHLAHRPEQRAFARALADLTRALDPSRPVVSNDGWEHTGSDVVTIHDYDADEVAVTVRYAEAGALEAVLNGLGPAGRPVTASWSVGTDLPVMVSEFGGIRFVPDDAAALNPQDPDLRDRGDAGDSGDFGDSAEVFDGAGEATWGYTTATGPQDFESRLGRAFGALQASPHLAGFCYTQLTDTMQEANGLVDASRRPKLDVAAIRRIVTSPTVA